MPALEIGNSAAASVGERVVVGGFGGRQHSVAARIVAKQEFAGYWEYVLDEAIFTAPAHPNWGGTALIGPAGQLLGIGSLQLQQAAEKGQTQNINMMVPIDLLKPIIDDLMKFGRRNVPPRPWLGLYATEVENRLVIVGLADRGPAKKADLRTGDICSRSPARTCATSPASSAASGRKARPASTCRSRSIATARPWSCASNRASAIGS